MTENGVGELPVMTVAEEVEVVAQEAPPTILARELEIEIVTEIETVTEIEHRAKIKTITVNVHVVHLREVAPKIVQQEELNVRVVL